MIVKMNNVGIIVDNFGIDPNATKTTWFAECFGKNNKRKSERLIEKEKRKQEKEREKKRIELENSMKTVTEYNDFYIHEINKREIEIQDLKDKNKMYKEGISYLEKVVDKLRYENWFYENKLDCSEMYYYVEGECVNYHRKGNGTPHFAKIKKINFHNKTFVLDVLMPNKIYILHYNVKATEISKVNVVLNDKEIFLEEHQEYIERIHNFTCNEQCSSDDYSETNLDENIIQEPSQIPTFIESEDIVPIQRIRCTIM
tara:strand:+ start:3912 stop:4682 length:771 start_codon:yes stop_codon:yes gene_type:complete